VRAALTLLFAGCGASVPARYVVEHDVGDDYRYRRYQKVLDVEVPVPSNPGEGHTAVYQKVAGAPGPPLAVAFVARYAKGHGLAMELKRAVSRLEGYEAAVREVGGGNAWVLAGEEGDRWAIWASGRYIVKVGTPDGRSLPDPVLERYMDVYPSELEDDGNPESGAESAGEASPEPERAAEETPTPNFLQ
jgi:hypothetical protein